MTAAGREADPIEERIEDRIEDPIEDYVAALAVALHGPARIKARMVAEIRDGLADAAAAHTGDGVPYHRAAGQAVREFGAVGELVPSCQRELTIAQTRHTARAVALTIPFLIACWCLIWIAGHDWRLPDPAQSPAAQLSGVTAVAVLLAAMFAATGALVRRLSTPRRLPLAVAWSGTTTGVAMGVSTLALVTVSALTTNWPLTACVGVLAAVSHAIMAASARACRRCSRLPIM
ncbi:permease prefix domain 1-containing protein [Streptosporangium sp. KLBMP 9127]|nr:permease prefix domain 1-containing protein [Streptosporangium sp. KLBMP 9127]